MGSKRSMNPEVLPNYGSLLQSILDMLVAHSEIFLVAAYHRFDPLEQQFDALYISVSKSAPRKYKIATKMVDGKTIHFPAGKGYLRDQIITDGITRVVFDGLKIPKVYCLKNGELSIDKSAYSPDKSALSAAGLSNFLLMSTRVPISKDNDLNNGYFSIVLPSDYTEIKARNQITVFEECEKIVHSDTTRRIFSGISIGDSQSDNRDDIIFDGLHMKRRRKLLLAIFLLLISIPILWFSITLGLPLVINANQNIIATIAVLAEIGVATVLWFISESRRRCFFRLSVV